MSKLRKVVCLIAVAAVVTAASAQVIPLGPHTSVYTGYTRGFSYTAPVDHTITNLEAPQESFVPGALASYLVGVNGVDAVYSMGNAGAIAVNVPVTTGDTVIIIGNWTDGVPGSFTAINSYAAGAPYATTILGSPVDLYRAGFQGDIAAGTASAAASFAGLTGSYGRILTTVVPEPATLGLLALGALALIRRR